jgi:hypothetical protein
MDIVTVQTALGLATTAVSLTGQATNTFETIKKLIAGSDKAASAEAQQLLNNLAHQLTLANMTNVEISSALRELSAQIEKENHFDQRLSRYQLFDTGHGDMLYMLRKDRAGDDPIHYVCPICIEKEKQFQFVVGHDTDDGKVCQGCSHYFQFSQIPVSHASVHYDR